MFDAIFSWNTLWYVLLFLYFPACFGLILIVLLQKGKGTGFAGAFGAGAGPGADAVFGPKSGQSLPVKLTYAAAALFMVIAMVMSVIASRVGTSAAPELVDADGSTVAAQNMLDVYGLGTGVVDEDRYSGVPDASAQESELNTVATPTAESLGAAAEDTAEESAPESESESAEPQEN
jgi:preprotein translocase subunit SecG